MGGADTIPGSGRSPGKGNGNPIQYSCLENHMVLIRVLHTCPGSICLEPRDRTWVGCVCNHVPGHPLLTVACSLVCWPSSEGALSWPDLLSDPSVMGSALQRLAQGRMGLTPGPEEDSLSLVSPSSPAKYFSASGARGREALPGPPGGLWADPSRPLQMRTPILPQVQRPWREDPACDAAEPGGHRAVQPRPDVGTAPASQAPQDRCAPKSQDSFPLL